MYQGQKENSMYIRKKYRIYPTKEQEQFLNQCIGNSRFVWNFFLSKIQEQYQTEKKFLFYNDTSKQLKSLKDTYEFLKISPSQAHQQTLKDLDGALKASYRKTSRFGFPKFKKKKFGGSFRLPQGCSISNNRLTLPKLKSDIKLVGKGIPETFNSLTIIKTATGKWFASFVVSFEPPEKVEIQNSVGIDLNSRYFVVLSSGHAIENPKFLKQKEARLKRYQRQVSRKIKGSSNRNKARIKVALQYEKIKNATNDWIDQITTNIAKTYDHISIEDLNVKAMQKFNGRMILMAPFGLFRDKITWKTNKFGKTLTVLNRFCPTSKVCSRCGSLLNLTLKDRYISCECGLEIHRDHNASLNIHRVGTTQIDACGETKQPENFKFQWVSLKQETRPLGRGSS